jgi:YD repeat-containing protein
VTHEVTLVVDDVDTVRKSVLLAYPRRRVPADPDHAAQGQLLATLTEVDVVHLDNVRDSYRLGIPIDSRIYELHGLVAPQEGFSFNALARAVAEADAQPLSDDEHTPAGSAKRLIQRIRTRYYDREVLRRRTELWVQAAGGSELLAERTIYGEQHPEAMTLNLRGRVYQQVDGAGLATNEAFDFKGNLLASTRRLAADPRTQPDWSQSPGPALQEEVFSKSTVYDALKRPTLITMPDGSEIRPRYNEAGLLDAVDIKLRWAADSMSVVTGITYDANGQRERCAYGNDVSTDYAYDPLTFRLKGRNNL